MTGGAKDDLEETNKWVVEKLEGPPPEIKKRK